MQLHFHPFIETSGFFFLQTFALFRKQSCPAREKMGAKVQNEVLEPKIFGANCRFGSNS
jgi:hypothetical protein